MPKETSLTPEQVKAAYDKVKAENGKASLRAVHAITKGSIKILTEMFNVIDAREHEADRHRHKPISEGLRVAIHQEIEERLVKDTTSLNDELTTAKESIAYLSDELTAASVTVDSLASELSQLRTTLEESNRQAAEMSMRSEVALTARTEQLDSTKVELNTVRQELEQMRGDAAKFAQAEADLKQLHKQLADAKESLHKAELRAIDAEARLDERLRISGRKSSQGKKPPATG